MLEPPTFITEFPTFFALAIAPLLLMLALAVFIVAETVAILFGLMLAICDFIERTEAAWISRFHL